MKFPVAPAGNEGKNVPAGQDFAPLSVKPRQHRATGAVRPGGAADYHCVEVLRRSRVLGNLIPDAEAGAKHHPQGRE